MGELPHKSVAGLVDRDLGLSYDPADRGHRGRGDGVSVGIDADDRDDGLG